METIYKDRLIMAGPALIAEIPFDYCAWVWFRGFREYLIFGNTEKQAIWNAKKAIDKRCDEKFIYKETRR